MSPGPSDLPVGKSHASPNTQLEELRALFDGRPDRDTWQRVCAVVDVDSSEVLRDYVAGHLEGWPDAARVAPDAWLRAAMDGTVDQRWSLVRSISLTDAHDPPSALARLLAEGKLGTITDLRVDARRHMGRASLPLVELIDHGALDELETLRLHGFAVSPPQIEALVRRFPTGLRDLSLRWTGLDRPAAQALADLPTSAVTSLDLSCNRLDDDAMAVLADSAILEGLARLDLHGNRLSARGATHLARAPSLPRRLRKIWERYATNPLTLAGAGTLLSVFDGERITLGRRPPSDIAISTVTLSKVHCRFEHRGDRALVSDARSTSGTFVNDRRATAPTPLAVGDRLRVGDLEIRVVAAP